MLPIAALALPAPSSSVIPSSSHENTNQLNRDLNTGLMGEYEYAENVNANLICCVCYAPFSSPGRQSTLFNGLLNPMAAYSRGSFTGFLETNHVMQPDG